jgi:hypothetical protein
MEETNAQLRIKYPSWPELERQKYAFFKCRYSRKIRNRDMPCYQATEDEASREDNHWGYVTFYIFIIAAGIVLILSLWRYLGERSAAVKPPA